MPGSSSLTLRLAVITGFLLTAPAGALVAQEKVGINSAVNTNATGTPPGAPSRRLVIGQDVVFNERITTDPAGQTQLLFLDQSSMAIGPNSDLTIDQFVYDPKSGTGKLAMSATRGLLRYVGGKLSKQDEAVTLRTSTATLAVRGGAFIVNITLNGSTDAIFIYGKGLTVTGTGGGSQTLIRPGFHVVANPLGQLSPPEPVPPGLLAQFTQALDGRTGGNGGAPVVPTDATVANSVVPGTISGNLAQSIQQSEESDPTTTSFVPQLQTYYSPTYTNQLAIQSTTLTSSTTSTTVTTQDSAGAGAGQVITCISQSACDPTTTTQVGTLAGQPVGGPNSVVSVGTMTNGFTNTTVTTGGVPNPPPGPYGGRLKSTSSPALGFVDNSAASDILYSGGTLANGTFTGSFGSFGTITFPLAAGFASIQGSSTAFGSFTGSSFLSADNSFFYANITPSGQPSQRLFIFGGTPVNASFYQPTGSTRVFAFTVQPDGALQSNIPFIRSQAGGNLSGATVSPLYIVAPPTTAVGDATTVSAARALQASLAVNGAGANQQSAIAVTTGEIGALASSGQPVLNGQMRGSSLLSALGTPVRLSSAASSTVDGNNNSLYGSGGISGFVVDQTAFSSGTPIIPSVASEMPLAGTAASYGFAQPALPTTAPSGVGTSRTSQALAGNFGGLMYPGGQATPNPYPVTGGIDLSTVAPTNRVQANLFGGQPNLLNPRLPSDPALNMQYGNVGPGAAGAQAFVDDNTFAAAENQAASPNSTGYIVSSGAAGAPAILPGGLCQQCQFLKWGYWGGDIEMTSATNPAFPRIDRGHINTWVAGVETPLSVMNSLIGTTATASYGGAALGSVFNNGQSYMAAGGFNGTYNFGSQTGSVTINNFDIFTTPITVAGPAPLSGPNRANYTFSASTAAATATVNGSFYGPAQTIGASHGPAETGGSFAIVGTGIPNYRAAGVFAGKLQ